VCITTDQPDTKSNANPIPNPNPTTKQHAIVNIQHILRVQINPYEACCCTVCTTLGCNCHTAVVIPYGMNYCPGVASPREECKSKSAGVGKRKLARPGTSVPAHIPLILTQCLLSVCLLSFAPTCQKPIKTALGPLRGAETSPT